MPRGAFFGTPRCLLTMSSAQQILGFWFGLTLLLVNRGSRSWHVCLIFNRNSVSSLFLIWWFSCPQFPEWSNPDFFVIETWAFPSFLDLPSYFEATWNIASWHAFRTCVVLFFDHVVRMCLQWRIQHLLPGNMWVYNTEAKLCRLLLYWRQRRMVMQVKRLEHFTKP